MAPVASRRRAVWLIAAAILVIAGLALALTERETTLSASVAAPAPTRGELAEFAETRVFFGHQSVGANIVSGVAPLYADASIPAARIVETRELSSLGPGGFLAHAAVGVNGDPVGKFEDFAAILDGPAGEQVDVALLKLCYADIVSSTDVSAVFDAYVELMSGLEAAHPSVRFIYTTVPLTTDRTWKSTLRTMISGDDQMGPADNVARERYNQMVRDRFADSGRLFDVAAVEATLNGDPMRRSLDGAGYHVLNRALSSDAGHLNDLGSRLAAGELVRVIAGSTPG